ncbi:MAG: F0F1 ATP synthase subunit epsilon [Calditrichaeota bacterium]|nr:F0F1 ATP synthase subunit epsilon [Calditrichota bacterium]RQV92864.1 MAG: F0F1 ATP synthase subunit epsilon [bacterium]RQW02013.1 MAG: F0F1 ATP synthase subunit epsilon [Calditrichota bacterium]
MKEGYLAVEITTPQKKWVFEDVSSCSAPGVEGGFQILINHAPLLNQITIGEIKLERETGTEIFATSGGFLEVLNDRVSLLLESCEKAEQIHIERAQKSAERARQRLKERTEKVDIVRAEVSLARALNRLRIGEKLK